MLPQIQKKKKKKKKKRVGCVSETHTVKNTEESVKSCCIKMINLRYSTSFICAVFFITGAVSGEDKAVGSSVSFRPAVIVQPVSSIIWKHTSSTGPVVKAIEWDSDDKAISIPNPRFQGITSLDEKTGQITITKLTFEHSGLYTIDINSKEQEKKFALNVIEPVPKPKITKDVNSKSDGVRLRCDYSGKIIWKNSTGQTVEDKKNEITVKNTGNPENFYTCTLKNTVSEETSDRVYERELFVTGAGPITGILIFIILLLLLIIILICIYLLKKSIYDRVNARCPRIESVLGYVDCCKTKREQYIITPRGDDMKNEAVSQGDEMKNEAVSQGDEMKNEAVSQGDEMKNEAVSQGDEMKNEAVSQGDEMKNEAVSQGDEMKNEAVSQGDEMKNEAVSQDQKDDCEYLM
ncbi:uncharacterized protein LOC127948594 isoform X11 [Carassius gibelio]|uniref:uncharacterized protein LOC127948594 isoform X11 n=1 Tax=Carassius gibelio TaxID=101364 RepID=UPI00227741F9|nr:uncharacterized protein LOC127948594 isoform X11 [Carassius gibelio]